MADIQAIYEMFGCRMNNAELAREALTLAGALGARAEGNKRLAMLGDKSIGVTVLKGWYECGTPCGMYTLLALLVVIGSTDCTLSFT